MVAKKTGMFYINSGNLYRGITWEILRRFPEGPRKENEEEMVKIAAECDFDIREGDLYLNGMNIEPELHTDAVDRWVAQVSSVVKIRSIVNSLLRKLARHMNAVVEGRDITTVVFPDAKVKIFLDASVETRAERRYHQGTSNLSIQEIADSIRQRDELDRNKVEGRLKLADDAVYIDTSDLTMTQVCEKVIDKIPQ
jgi:cytidylate kinase